MPTTEDSEREQAAAARAKALADLVWHVGALVARKTRQYLDDDA